jgi:predicted DsbA family dithiol-disulfide isomerase
VQDAVVERLFRAYFCEGINLSNRWELIDVVESAGLDRVQVQRLLDSNEGLAQVLSEEQQVKAMGLSAVPLFIIEDRLAVSGAQSVDTLLHALEGN